jgi:hypothetical protein
MRRPQWADSFICAIFVLLMTWVAFDFYSSKGWDPFLLVPLFFGMTPCIFVFVLRQPIEAFLLFLVWLLACIGVFSGVFEGETGFPGKNSDLSISLATNPVWFSIAMVVNIAIAIGGIAAAVSLCRRPRAL